MKFKLNEIDVIASDFYHRAVEHWQAHFSKSDLIIKHLCIDSLSQIICCLSCSRQIAFICRKRFFFYYMYIVYDLLLCVGTIWFWISTTFPDVLFELARLGSVTSNKVNQNYFCKKINSNRC